MKKFLCYTAILLGVALIIVAFYLHAKINYVMQVVDDQMYDGFDESYVNGNPYSKYTILEYASFITGICFISSARDKLTKEKTLNQINNLSKK